MQVEALKEQVNEAIINKAQKMMDRGEQRWNRLHARVWRVVERCALALFSAQFSMWRERERARHDPFHTLAALTGSASLACALAVHSANDRAEYDADMLSMVDNHFHIDTSKSKRLDPRELPPSDFLMFTEDYSGERCLDARRLRPARAPSQCPGLVPGDR